MPIAIVHLIFWILGGVTDPAAAWLLPLRGCFSLFSGGDPCFLCIFEQDYTGIAIAYYVHNGVYVHKIMIWCSFKRDALYIVCQLFAKLYFYE